ncbi:hypothetical protein BU17DRAFT_55145 [Hysterangium stoloniferum]|nr:hypothetical protein BU17DRAFT_55145 [Hysterangium stoloniferum]
MSLIACAVVPLVESSRDRKPLYPGVPAALGLIYQMYTGGAILPIFWIILIAIVGERGAGSQISQAKAESVLAAVLFGYYLPSFAMNFYPSIPSIATWQIFPLCMSVISTVYTQLRSSHAHQSSGYQTTQLVYIIIAIGAACTHMATLTLYGFDLQHYLDACIPWTRHNASNGHTILWTKIHFLQWDAVYIFSSTFLASLWFARSLPQAAGIAAWLAIATLIVGPGAAFAATLIWREMKLKEERTQLAARAAKSE